MRTRRSIGAGSSGSASDLGASPFVALPVAGAIVLYRGELWHLESRNVTYHRPVDEEGAVAKLAVLYHDSELSRHRDRRLPTAPLDLNRRHVFGAGLLGGIVVTMSIFITNLAFVGNAETINASKMAILLASLTA